MIQPPTTGYITTTQIVFLLVVEDDPMATTAQHQRRIDESIQKLFMQIHQFYVEYILNPFTPISVAGPIESPRFHRQVQDCVTSYNRSFL
jgi:Sedlin, N-terminal conserved region